VDCSEGCSTAAVMFGVDGVRVLSAERDDVKLRLLVETDRTVAGCPQCGVIAAAHGRGVQVLHDTERQRAKLVSCLDADDPNDEVAMAWSCYQQLRQIYSGPQPAKARRALAEKVIPSFPSFPSCPIPEVARLGRTLRAWRSQVLAYFDTGGVSNGGTEAINMLIGKGRRLAHGSANLKNYRPRMLLATEGQRSQRPGTSPW